MQCPKCGKEMEYHVAIEDQDYFFSIANGGWTCTECPDVEVYDYK